MQAETGQPIYFWNRLLKAVVLQKTDFLFTLHAARTGTSLHLYFSAFIHRFVPFHKKWVAIQNMTQLLRRGIFGSVLKNITLFIF